MSRVRPDGGRSLQRFGISLCLLALVGGLYWRELGVFVAPDPPMVFEVRDDIRTLRRLEDWPTANGRFENEGFVPCREGTWTQAGWCLPPGVSGTLRYVLPRHPEARSLLMRLFFFRSDPRAMSRLRIFREGQTIPRMTFENVHFADARLDLSPALEGPGGAVVVSFEGDNPTAQSDVMVQHLEVRGFAEPLPVLPSVIRMSLIVLALGLCWLPLIAWKRLLPLWAIVSLGFALRYYALARVFLLPLDWDALGYYHLAQDMALFTKTGFHSAQFGVREPMFLLVVKIALGALGNAETHVRLVSFFGSLAVMLFTYRVGAKLLSRSFGLCGAFIMAVNLPLVRESVRGLRLEWELVLLLALAEVLFLKTVRRPWSRSLLAGLLAGALALTRVAYLVTLIPILLYGLLRESPRRRLGSAAAAVLMMIGLLAPSRWNMYRRYGDPFEDSAQYARWLANAEFAGTPGFPGTLQMWRQTDQGSRLTYREYLFTLHTVPELIVGTLRGTWKVVRHMDVVAFHQMMTRVTGLHLMVVDMGFQVLGLLGLLLAALSPTFRWLPLMFLSLLMPIAMLYDRGLLEPWRQVYQAFPWMLLACLLALHRGRQALSLFRGRCSKVGWIKRVLPMRVEVIGEGSAR